MHIWHILTAVHSLRFGCFRGFMRNLCVRFLRMISCRYRRGVPGSKVQLAACLCVAVRGAALSGVAISSWVILDPQTHRVLRPATVPAAANYVCAERETMPMPGKLDCQTLPFHHAHQVTYSDLDINRHLNNVRIAELVSDSLELGETDFVRSIQINYTAETPPHAQLELCAARTPDAFSVCGVSDGSVKFQAAGTFASLPSDQLS